MPEDYYKDGFNQGYGRGYLNDNHDLPQSDSERYDYDQGVEDGERRRDYTFDED